MAEIWNKSSIFEHTLAAKDACEMFMVACLPYCVISMKIVHSKEASDLRVKDNDILLYSSEEGFWVGTRDKNAFQPFDTIRYNRILNSLFFSFFKLKQIQCEIGLYGSMVKGITKNPAR